MICLLLPWVNSRATLLLLGPAAATASAPGQFRSVGLVRIFGRKKLPTPVEDDLYGPNPNLGMVWWFIMGTEGYKRVSVSGLHTFRKGELTVSCTGNARVRVGRVQTSMRLGRAVQGPFVAAHVRTEAALGLFWRLCLKTISGPFWTEVNLNKQLRQYKVTVITGFDKSTGF